MQYAAIHLDESTPHMHIYFTPVVDEVVYDILMPNSTKKKICEFCLEDLEDEIKRIRNLIDKNKI